jgi:hypothetical protein
LRSIKKEHIILPVNGLFLYVDAFDMDNENICNEHNIDEIPHTKVYDDNEVLVFDKIGLFDPKRLWDKIYPDENKRKIAIEKSKRM